MKPSTRLFIACGCLLLVDAACHGNVIGSTVAALFLLDAVMISPGEAE